MCKSACCSAVIAVVLLALSGKSPCTSWLLCLVVFLFVFVSFRGGWNNVQSMKEKGGREEREKQEEERMTSCHLALSLFLPFILLLSALPASCRSYIDRCLLRLRLSLPVATPAGQGRPDREPYGGCVGESISR